MVLVATYTARLVGLRVCDNGFATYIERLVVLRGAIEKKRKRKRARERERERVV
jgi:hypothetical protein